MNEDGWVNMGHTDEGTHVYANLEEFIAYLDEIEDEDD